MSAVPRVEAESAWKLLVVDDDDEVHVVTRLVLNQFRFDGKSMAMLSAHSAREARAVLREHSDIAVILLDVVMETEEAGLDLVRFVREELKNHFVRIVLRTGQPGVAPEHDVIERYDINDYKGKSELTAQRLKTSMYAALRAYRDLRTIEASRRGLERVIEASRHIFSHKHSHQFASAVLEQLGVLIGIGRGALYCTVPLAPPPPLQPEHFVVSAATGDFASLVSSNADERLPADVAGSLKRAFYEKRHLFGHDHYVLHFTDSRQQESLLYVGDAFELSELDLKLLEVFCTNVSIAFENLHLNHELFDSQLEMICLLAGAAETRSRETANHVKRVGLLAEFFAKECGLDDKLAEQLRFAAPLHDLGKIAIPDEILNKPGKHTPEETEVMRTHAELGYQLLASSRRPLLQLAGEIARHHHENWDGSGYPRGLHGEDIPISGRITMLADVFDALGSTRCYKSAWGADDIQAFIRQERGRKLDPRLADILLANWERAMLLRQLLPD